MSRWTDRATVLLILLAVVALSALPAFAAEEEAAPTATAQDPLLEEPAEELPNLTPAVETPEALLDPNDDLRFDAIRICSPGEEAQCPSGCACVVIRNEVNCFC